jgi:hypothetical protein
LEKQEALREKDEARRSMGSFQTFSVKASVEDAPYIGPDRIESRISGSTTTSLDREWSTTTHTAADTHTHTRAREAPSDRSSPQMSSHGGTHLSAAPAAGSFPQSRPNSNTSGPVVLYSVSRTERPNSVPVGQDKIARQHGTISESPGNGEAKTPPTMNQTQAGVGLALVNNGHGAALRMVVRSLCADAHCLPRWVCVRE